MSYRTAVHHAHLVLSLCNKASKYLRDLFEPPDVTNFFFCCSKPISYNKYFYNYRMK